MAKFKTSNIFKVHDTIKTSLLPAFSSTGWKTCGCVDVSVPRCVLLQAPYNVSNVVQADGCMRNNGEQAKELVAALHAAGVQHTAHFVDAGHKASSDGMGIALKGCVDDFARSLK